MTEIFKVCKLCKGLGKHTGAGMLWVTCPTCFGLGKIKVEDIKKVEENQQLMNKDNTKEEINQDNKQSYSAGKHPNTLANLKGNKKQKD
jgi:predicted transcriptional regulator